MILRGSLTVRRLSPTPAVVIQAGTRTFVKDGSSYSPASIVVRAETRNVKEPVYEWGLLSGGSFTAVPSWTGDAITVLPEQAGVVMVKVYGSNITDPVTDYVDISIVEDGENGESLSGRMLHTDPTFKAGMNGVSKYSNAAAEVKALLVVERVERPEDAPTTSTHCLRVTCKAEQSPGFGGVYQTIQSRANAVFIQKVIAKLPEGYALNWAANSMGTGRAVKWLTPVAGTGKYETYLLKITCGAEGDFSTGGHLYVTGSPVPTEEAPLVWHIAYMTAFDQTDDGYEQIETSSKDALAEKLGYGSWKDMVDAVASSGSIIQGDYINAKLIDVETLATDQAFIDKLLGNELEFKMGKIGKFNIGENRIYTDGASESDAFTGPVPAGVKQVINANDTFIVSERGDLLLGDPFNLKGNGQYGLALINNEGYTVLNLYGNVYAQGGRVGDWVISEGYLKSSDFSYPSDDGNYRTGGAGCLLDPEGGLMVVAKSNGILMGSTGMKQAGLIMARGDNAGIIGLEVYAENTFAYGTFNEVRGLVVTAKTAYPSPSFRPRAIDAVAGDVVVGDGHVVIESGYLKTKGLCLSGFKSVSRGGTATVPADVSVILASGGFNLSTSGIGNGQVAFVINTSADEINVQNTRFGSAPISKYSCRYFIYYGGYWYQMSDKA